MLYRVAAELDDRRLVEESTGVEQQDKKSTAAEPVAHATQVTPGAHEQLLPPDLRVSVLLVQRRDAVVEQWHARTAVELDEKREEHRTYQTYQYLQHVTSIVIIIIIIIITSVVDVIYNTCRTIQQSQQSAECCTLSVEMADS